MLSLYLSMVETEEERDLVTELYNTYEHMMYKIAFGILKNKQDAEDAVSESFIKVIKNLDKISGIDENKRKGFLVIVAKNAAIDIYNKRKHDEHLDLDDAVAISGGDVEEEVFERYDIEVLHTHINSLKVEYSEVLSLKYFYGMSNDEISQITGLTYAGASKRLQSAKRALYAGLTEVRT